MHAEAPATEPEIGGTAERVGADEDTPLRPPQRHLAPAPLHANSDELERAERLFRHFFMSNAETIRDCGAVARVAVEQLDHPRRSPGSTDPLLDACVGHRVDDPHLPVGDERVRAALHELVLDPAEPVLELVYDFHCPAHRSKPGKSFARAAAMSSSTSNGTRRNSTASESPSTTAYALTG